MTGMDTVRKDLWQQICSHREALCMLSSRWNSLAPISRLPSEIMTEIFIAHLNICYVECMRNHTLYWKRITSISHVCSRWRSVALGCQKLWSCVVVNTHPEWMEEVLRRSRSTSLVLRVEVPAESQEQMQRSLHVVLSRKCRIHDLWVVAPKQWLYNMLDALRDSTVSLDRMSLRAETSTSSIGSIGSLANRPSKNYDFIGKATLLQYLNLHDIPFPWGSSASFPLLKTFIASHCRNYSGTIPTAADVTTTLGRLPALEKLELAFNLWARVMGDHRHDHTARVILPSLQTLTLKSVAISCAAILSLLSLPSATHVSLQGLSQQGTIELSHVLAETMPRVADILALNIDSSFHNDNGTRVQGSTDDLPVECLNSIERTATIIDIVFLPPYSQVDRRPREVWIDFCSHMPLANVRTLNISCQNLTKEQWLKFIEQMPQLTSLRVNHAAAIQLPYVLDSRSRHNPSHYLLHRLRVLHFDKVMFGNTPTVYEGVTWTYMKALILILVARQSCQATLQTIVLTNCEDVGEANFCRLIEVVPEVTGDEHVQRSIQMAEEGLDWVQWGNSD
ncbi:hypothetical protein WOLCODRAFT_164956 [Wolfiporia cocos MD-104 SS10]|uniref:Uncharacterized protein n=1 Tax=Wolfiporia cocos (strain MD-104) TaxID=742152 RepID=A0A2H3K6W1_WOLCO|nr:hypothetical protein WOLCODRAFT_164956 [Wolfiporia cocos MD-104 SS10]